MAGSTDFINNTILKIDSVTDASSHTQGGTPVGTIYQLNPFLQDVGISLSLNEQGLTDMTNYFVINSVDVYLDPSKNGEKLEANKLGFEEYVDYLINKQNDANYIVTISDVSLIFQFNLQPRLYVEGNEISTQQEVQITRTYDFEVSGGNIVGKAQDITFGEISSSVDISCYGYDYLQAKIYKGITPIEDGAIDVGEYYIKLEFKDSVTDDQRKDCWLYYIEELQCRIKLVVDPATVTLQLDESNSAKFNKDYSKSSEYAVGLRQYVKNGTTVYGSVDKNIILKGTDNKGRSFDLTNVNIASDDKGVIVSGGKTAGLTNQMYVTNSEVHILITGLRITDNSNIVLKLEEFDCYENAEDTMPDKKQGLLIENIVKIVPKVVDIVNFEVFDKVEDEDAFADFSFKEGETEYIQWIFENDKVNFLKEEVKVYFTSKPIEDGENILDIADATVDSNKYIVIDARSALDGADKNNYVIGNKGFINFKDTKTIYPRKVNAPIKGVGTVELVNERGVQDYRKANLIPVGATLVVERIEPNSAGYRDIESMLTEFVSRRNVFAAGYKLVLLDKNGKEIKISNELYLSMPTETDLMNVVSLAGDRAKSVDFTKDGGNIIIDLSQIEEDISTFCLIQNRALLKAWQIVLIVVLSLVGAAGIGIGVFFIIRRRRLKNEKYDTI